MATYLLTYNPAKWNWPVADRAAAVRRTAVGKTSTGSWSTGNRKTGITPGDTAVLLRQGTGDRGLIGRGTFMSAVYQDLHWDNSGRNANYADVEWDLMLADSDMVPISVAAAAVTTVLWDNIQASGILVPSPGDAALTQLWPTLAGAGPASGKKSAKPGTKQAWQSDPLRRKAAEDHAQALLEAKYRKAGWTVRDTRVGNPYDAIAHKGKKTRYLEAKGTETDGLTVLVTAGEVAWAKKHPGECSLGVVSGIKFDATGALDKSSGSLQEYDWDPTTGLLAARTYAWTPPAP